MATLATIVDDIKAAMLARDEVRLSVLRLLKSELHNAQIAKGEALNEDEITAIIKRETKKRQEAAALYEKAGSAERVSSEKAEATILAEYLPAQRSQEELITYVKSLIDTGAAGPSDTGTLIRLTIANFGSSTDGRAVAAAISQLSK